MKTLFSWLGHSYRPLTLAECLSIINITCEDPFDLDRELQGRQLARILRLGDLEERMTDTEAEDIKLRVQSGNKADAPLTDGDLPLKFQERSMAGFFGAASEGLRTNKQDANREIFITSSDILCGRKPTADKGLRQYAATYWLMHLSWSYPGQDSESNRIRSLNALGALMSNETDAARAVEDRGVDYDRICQGFEDGLLLTDMALWAKMAAPLKGKLTATTDQWAEGVAKDAHTAFDQLARGHVTNWFAAVLPKDAAHSFRFAFTAINLVSPLILCFDIGSSSTSPRTEQHSTIDAQLGLGSHIWPLRGFL
jgi:hypothetical protein